MTVHLREVTRETVIAVCKLDAGDDRKHVAPNSVSIAQAHFQGEAWFRAVYEDEQLVGFVMLYDPTLTEQPDEPDFFLWRLMIDKAHQGKGYGQAWSTCARARARAGCWCRTSRAPTGCRGSIGRSISPTPAMKPMANW